MLSGKGIFMNRAAMKMANMDRVFDFMFTNPTTEDGRSLGEYLLDLDNYNRTSRVICQLAFYLFIIYFNSTKIFIQKLFSPWKF